MSEKTIHPSPEELSAFSLGQLPADAAVAVESHVSKCQPCCDTLLGLSSDDTFVGLLQEAEQLPPDQTVDCELPALPCTHSQEVPTPLAAHPRYEIRRLLGKGGMGDVFEARHRKMKRTVALKVIKRELVRKPNAVDRFHREVTTAAQLSHPNIVTAYDADQADDFHFMVMEFVDGVDLSQTVKDRGALPVAEACDYMQQVAVGLQHAHERGMVHRDIKPHNLMVTKNGTVKILDFGLASLAPKALLEPDAVEDRGDLTAAGAIMGTPDFISPEQADDARTADIRSDIYSLGATLYFLLSAQPPFAEGNIMHKLKSHAQSEPEPLSTVRLDVPADLAEVITRMMAKDPDERFQTPEELAEALRPFSQSDEPREIVETPTQVQPRRSKPTFLSPTAITLLFVATVFAGILYYIQTNHGVVRVEVSDPTLQVTVNNQTITMKDEDGKTLKIRPGLQRLIVRKGDASFEFETDSFQIRRGDKVAFKVEMLMGEIVVRKDGERFHSKALSDAIEVRQILDRMLKAYAECKSYRDSGVIKSVFRKNTGSTEYDVEHSFTTAFERPDRFRFEIRNEDNSLLISANEQDVQASWDLDPEIQEPETLDFAMAQAIGFSGGDVSRIPAMLMPQKLEISGAFDLIDPKQVEDGKLKNAECFRLEYNFRDEQITLWIDKQTYLVRQIDEWVNAGGFRIERTMTYDPIVDGKITDEMLNAALVYWQAFALLPELNEGDSQLLNDLEKGSQLGDEARSLLARGATALSLISHLQLDTPCRWDLIEDGPSTLLPHLSKAHMLARMLVLQARLDAESGEMEAAVDHLTQAFLIARHISEGSMVQMVVADTIESLAADAAESLLPQLDASSRGRFAKKLSQLPLRKTFAQAMSYERDVFGGEAGKMLSDSLEQFGQGKDSPAVQAILTATKSQQESWLEELLAEYDKVIEASELPLAEANKELARLEVGVQDSPNPLIRLLMPSFVGTHQRHAQVDARIAELKKMITEHSTKNVTQRSRKARASLSHANLYEQKGEFAKAADAYLEVYRLEPSLLKYDHFATIKRAQRTREFVEVFTVDRLKKVPQSGHRSDGAKLKIVQDLLLDDATCLDGNVFLKNMWATTNATGRRYLLNPPYNRIWPHVIDTTFLIRDLVLPTDIPAEGAGWKRFTRDLSSERGGPGSSDALNLRLLLNKIPQKKVTLSKFAREVEAKTQQFPGWKAGVAVLGFLEAELGNEQRAVELFETLLTDSVESIPPASACVFGLALEGKGKELDQIVMRLYEIDVNGQRDPAYSLRQSAIGALARLYAKYDRRDDARQLLLRLTKPEGPRFGDESSQWVLCACSSQFGIIRETEAGYTVLPEDRLPQDSCIKCHRKERNLENYILMANGLTDVGFSVDARLALGRIGASFYNAYGSDEAWAKANTSVSDWEFQGEEAFQPAIAKAERAITPQAVIHALESGVTIETEMKQFVIAKNATNIDLMLGVRGENGKSTLFSPVIDMLEIAAKAKGDEAAIANVKIDQLLAEAFDKNPDNVEAGIAAAVFAFQRNDLDAAEGRTRKLEKLLAGKEPQESDVALWLVASMALARERTKAIGEQLADRATTAARKQSDPLWEEAILRGREDL